MILPASINKIFAYSESNLKTTAAARRKKKKRCTKAFSSSVYAIASISEINPSTIGFPASVAVSTFLVELVKNLRIIYKPI